MKSITLLGLLACCAIASAQEIGGGHLETEQIGGGHLETEQIGGGHLETEQGFPEFSLPGTDLSGTVKNIIQDAFSGPRRKKTCDGSLPKAEYINCCGPQDTCDFTRVRGSFTEETVKEVSCEALEHLNSETFESILKTENSAASSCFSSIIADNFIEFKGAPNTWNTTEFESIPERSIATLNLTSLSEIPAAILQNEKGLRRLGSSMETMTVNQIGTVFEKIETAFGEVETWNGNRLQEVMTRAPRSICGMSTGELSEIRGVSVVSAIDSMANALEGCREKDPATTEALSQSVLSRYRSTEGDVTSWNATTLNRLGPLKRALSSPDLWKMPESALTDRTTFTQNDTTFDGRQKSTVTATVRQHLSKKRKNPAGAGDVLEELPHALTSMEGSEIMTLDCSSFMDHFQKAASTSVPRMGLQTAARRYLNCTSSTPSQPLEEARKLAPFAPGLDSSVLQMVIGQHITDPEVTRMLPDGLTRVQGRALQRSSIAALGRSKRMVEGSETQIMKTVPKFFLEFTNVGDQVLSRFNVSDFKQSSRDKVEVARSLSSQFAKQTLEEIGTNFSNFRATLFEEFGGNIVMGFNRTTLRNLPRGPLRDLASSASKHDLSAGQTQALADRFTAAEVSTFTEQDVRDLGRVTTQWRPEVVKALPSGAKAQYVRNLGQTKRLLGYAGSRELLAEMMPEAVMSLTGKRDGQLTHDNLQALGSLQHFLEPEQLSRIRPAELKASVSPLSSSVDGETTGEASARLTKIATVVHEKLKDTSNGLEDSVVKNLGNASCYLPEAYFKSLTTKDKFDAVLETLGNSDCAATSTAHTTLFQKTKEYYGSPDQMSTSVIRAVNKGLSAMSMEDIDSLQPKKIRDTLETFGKVKFTEEQRNRIVTKIAPGLVASQEHRGPRSAANVEPLTSTEFQNLGSLACSIDPTRLSSRMMSPDDICSLSKEQCYTDEQKREYMSIINSVKANIDDTTTCLGQFATALTKADVEKMPMATFRKNADVLGGVTHEVAEVRQALSAKAMEAFGTDVSKWDEGVVGFVGNIAGYIGEPMPGSSCSTKAQEMTADQIGTIEPSVIPNLRNLQCMAMTQLSALDGEQARAVSKAQVSTLTLSQQSTVSTASCQPACARASSSGASSIAATLLVAVPVLAAFIF